MPDPGLLEFGERVPRHEPAVLGLREPVDGLPHGGAIPDAVEVPTLTEGKMRSGVRQIRRAACILHLNIPLALSNGRPACSLYS